MKAYENIREQLSGLRLKGMIRSLDAEVEKAESGSLSYAAFLNNLLEAESLCRIERRYQRSMTGAHFPVEKKMDNFRYENVTGVTSKEIAQIMEFGWLDNHCNLMIFGPPGLGKTHIAISVGIKAVEKGYTVSFERMPNLIRLLKTSEIQKTASFRLNRILKSDLVIIDEIGYTPIDKKEANLFFNLVSELYEKKSVVITSNKGFEEWAEMMGDPVMTSALLDRLLHHARILNLTGQSYRIQNSIKEVK